MSRALNNFLLVILLLSILACNNKIIQPGKATVNIATKNNDEYNYMFSEGIRLKLMGEKAESIKCFEKCISLNHESDAAYFQIGQILLMTGNLNNAKNYIQKAYKINLNNKWYPILLSRIYEQLNSPDSMQYFLEKSIELDPENYELNLRIAEIYSIKGNTEESGKILQKLVQKYGLNENNGMLLIKTLLEGKDFDRAKDLALELMEMYPDDVFYKTLLAQVYVKTDEKEKALTIFKNLLDGEYKNPEVFYWYGEFLLDNHDIKNFLQEADYIFSNLNEGQKINIATKLISDDSVIKLWRESIENILIKLEKTVPGSQPIALLRSSLYEKTGEKEKLENNLRSVIEKDRTNYFAWEKLMFFYAETKNWNSLYDLAGNCSREFNMSYIAKILYANAALEKGDYNVAVNEALKAKILAGDVKEAYVQAGLIEADAYYRSGNYSKAFTVFDELLKQEPDNLTLLNNYAYYLAERNMEPELALRMIKTVIEKEPENKTFLDTFAWVLFKKGKKRRALNIMLDIIRDESTKDAEYYEHTGYIYKKMGKCRDAVLMWQNAIKIDKNKSYLIEEIEACKR